MKLMFLYHISQVNTEKIDAEIEKIATRVLKVQEIPI